MKILIIEDEKMAAQTLKGALLHIAPEIEIVSVISTVKGSIKYLLSNPQLDLIFLDIHLADGSSFEIFEKVLPDIPIVFVTAYDAYAVRAFEMNSLDYLLKPISTKRLEQTIDRFKHQRNLPGGAAIKELTAMLRNLQVSGQNYKTRFLVKGVSKLVPVDVQQIAYFFCGKDGVYLVTSKGKHHLINYSLETLDDSLDPKLFFRLNRQVIVHFTALEAIHNYFNGKLKITLKPGEPFEVFVSQERSRFFKEWLER